ncbi:GNAT family N-acetyltransferase [Candidatus Pelagibacter sp.]|nr:GNAT family N-acetyltransferase [Candidatus Pelagibacter sp.]
MLKSIEGNFDNPEVNKLLTKHFIELRAASPEGSAHVLDIPGLKVSSIKFWSFWKSEKIFGCGALKFLDKNHGEFKSIRIHDDFRNQGNGIKVIEHLIEKAKKLEIKRISLETGAGKFFDPARKVFKKCDFTPCKPFAHYKEDVNSIYLTKLINNE